MTNHATFYESIKVEAIKKGFYTDMALAKAAGINPQTFHRLKSIPVKRLSFDNAMKLMLALDISYEDFCNLYKATR